MTALQVVIFRKSRCSAGLIGVKLMSKEFFTLLNTFIPACTLVLFTDCRSRSARAVATCFLEGFVCLISDERCHTDHVAQSLDNGSAACLMCLLVSYSTASSTCRETEKWGNRIW